MEKIPNSKIRAIRSHYLSGAINRTHLANELELSVNTVKKYIAKFNKIKLLYPGKIKDFRFMLPKKKREPTVLFNQLIQALPLLIDRAITKKLNSTAIWQDYRSFYPAGYALDRFLRHYNKWRGENNICRFYPRRVKCISEEDRKILITWRTTSDKEHWKKSVVILDSFKGRTMIDMAAQVERSLETIMLWIKSYNAHGIEGIKHKARTANAEVIQRMELRQSNLIKLLHQTPKIHGINRVTWRIEDLAVIYSKLYTPSVSHAVVSTDLKTLGYGFKKSRNVLTSPDPKFREKVDHIKFILSNLGKREKFFSIDEYGPANITLKGGWSIVEQSQTKSVPARQKSKGWYICTAALELSTNQVTHFYSLTKNTAEMIKLLDILLVQYSDQKKIYLSWDSAKWHMSNALIAKLEEINGKSYRLLHKTPAVALAPLPTSAQFLNIIEAVFSGMAKAVIHNSDYQSVDKCKEAIDCYFKERNEHFIKFPKRAGNYLWGSETVKPVFDETNNCKSKKAMKVF